MTCLSSTVEPTPTLYDETRRDIWHSTLEILSIGDSAALIASLEHHDPSTDGNFAVCIAAGKGNFISQKVYNSIPEEHRPQMETQDRKVTFLFGNSANTVGRTFIPILLTNAKNGERFRIVLQAYILEKMTMGMFISHPSWMEEILYEKDGCEYICNFGKDNAGEGNVVMLKDIRGE